MRWLKKALMRVAIVSACLFLGIDSALAIEASRIVVDMTQQPPDAGSHEAGKVHQ